MSDSWTDLTHDISLQILIPVTQLQIVNSRNRIKPLSLPIPTARVKFRSQAPGEYHMAKKRTKS